MKWAKQEARTPYGRENQANCIRCKLQATIRNEHTETEIERDIERNERKQKLKQELNIN